MYIPAKMGMQDLAQMQQFVDDYPFGVLISADLQATHLPFLLERDCGERGVLLAHFARVNPHWESLDGAEVLVIFNGPHAYVSPQWYAVAPAVPTWNYASVHVRGRVSIIENDEQVHAVLDQLMRKFEPGLLEQRDVVTHDVQQKMRRAIVGFQIEICSIEGKEKLGQLRSVGDQLGVVDGLQRSNTNESAALLDYMRARQLGLGEPVDN